MTTVALAPRETVVDSSAARLVNDDWCLQRSRDLRIVRRDGGERVRPLRIKRRVEHELIAAIQGRQRISRNHIRSGETARRGANQTTIEEYLY